jgi:hypothetical protein
MMWPAIPFRALASALPVRTSLFVSYCLLFQAGPSLPSLCGSFLVGFSKDPNSPKLPRARKILTEFDRQNFLDAYARTGSVCASAKLAGFDISAHYDWLKAVPGYPERFQEAHQKAIEVLENEARRRAVEGVKEPVFYKGQVVGEIQRYSDVLLMFLLKGVAPAKYRENSKVEISGTDGEPIRLEIAAAIAKVYGTREKAAQVVSEPQKAVQPETTMPIADTAERATPRLTGQEATVTPSSDQNASQSKPYAIKR